MWSREMITKRKQTWLKRFALLAIIGCAMLTSSGCKLFLWQGFLGTAVNGARFWWTTPVIPVSAYYSEAIEDAYWREERYDKVPILDPVEGENAPLFCMDPPSQDEVMRALPNDTSAGWTFVAETSRNNVRIVVENIVDRIDDCRFFPMAGPARLHHCHYKCTVYYDKTIRSDWPIPFTHRDETVDVVYVDHDHLIRCAGPATPQ
jgi:hypothetical protein